MLEVEQPHEAEPGTRCGNNLRGRQVDRERETDRQTDMTRRPNDNSRGNEKKVKSYTHLFFFLSC